MINPQITQIFTDFLKKYFVLICGNLRNLRIYNFFNIKNTGAIKKERNSSLFPIIGKFTI